MPAAGRLGDLAQNLTDAHGCPACPHPVTGPAISGSPDTMINRRPALRVGDPGIHAACCNTNSWKAQSGSAGVFINGKAAYRKGDPSKHCGGTGKLIQGSPNVVIGEQLAEKPPPVSFEGGFRLLDHVSGLAIAYQAYRLICADGSILEGVTDEKGYTALIPAEKEEDVELELVNDEIPDEPPVEDADEDDDDDIWADVDPESESATVEAPPQVLKAKKHKTVKTKDDAGASSSPGKGFLDVKVTDKRKAILEEAMKYVNAKSPYYWGAQGPKYFDCSGLTHYVLYKVGLVSAGARTTAAGYAARYPATKTPKPGDLVFFRGKSKITHVGIVLGKGTLFIGANGGGSKDFGKNPKAFVKISDWQKDRRTKSFGSLDDLIAKHRAITK